MMLGQALYPVRTPQLDDSLGGRERHLVLEELRAQLDGRGRLQEYGDSENASDGGQRQRDLAGVGVVDDGSDTRHGDVVKPMRRVLAVNHVVRE